MFPELLGGVKIRRQGLFSERRDEQEFAKCGLWSTKGTLSDDTKTINVSEMKFAALAAPDSEKITATSAKDKTPVQEWSGEVFHTGKFLPSLTAGAEKFGLKPAKDAPYAVKAMLTQIGGGELTGKFQVSGTTYKDDVRNWIVVEKISQDAPLTK